MSLYSRVLVSTRMSVPLGGAAWLRNGSCGARTRSARSSGGGGVSTVGGAGHGTYADSALASVFDDDALRHDAELGGYGVYGTPPPVRSQSALYDDGGMEEDAKTDGAAYGGERVFSRVMYGARAREVGDGGGEREAESAAAALAALVQPICWSSGGPIT